MEARITEPLPRLHHRRTGQHRGRKLAVPAHVTPFPHALPRSRTRNIYPSIAHQAAHSISHTHSHTRARTLHLQHAHTPASRSAHAHITPPSDNRRLARARTPSSDQTRTPPTKRRMSLDNLRVHEPGERARKSFAKRGVRRTWARSSRDPWGC
jgi:hypothetical protein